MSGCGADSGQGDAAGSDCSEVLHRVYEYLDGEMTHDDTVKIKHHLEECGPCLQEYDLPTQTGYDPDHVLSRGEVGKVGVPVSHLGHGSGPRASGACRDGRDRRRRGGRTMWFDRPFAASCAGSGVGLAAVVGRIALARAALAGALAHG